MGLLSSIGEMLVNLWESSGLANGDWQNYVMIVVSLVLMYLAIVKKFEPLLLLPIAFGMFLINIPGAQNIVWGRYETVDLSLAIGKNGEVEYAGVYLDNLTDAVIYVRDGYLNGNILTYYANFEALQSGTASTLTLTGDFAELYTLQGFVQGTVNEVLKDGSVISTFTSDALVISHDYMDVTNRGLLWYLYFGVENVIYPPLIFMGIGAMTDFGPLIANPKSMLIGAGAQLGVFLTLVGAVVLNFDAAAAASIAIIGGADGPTAIYLTKMLSAFTSSDLLATIAIAAYSYMALIPIIQKPIMKLMTTKKERAIKMKQLREFGGTHDFKITAIDAKGGTTEKTLSITIPSEQSGGPSIVWTGYDIDQRYTVTDGMTVDIVANVPAGIKSFVVTIISDTLTPSELRGVGLCDQLDLVNPENSKDSENPDNTNTSGIQTALDGFGFPTGDKVLNQTNVGFSITGFLPLLSITGAGDHNFVMTIVDNDDVTIEKTLMLRTE